MPIEITMPQLSDTMTEGTVAKWLKKEGDKVKAGEMLAEVETDKATMEMEAFEGGTLAVVLTKEGQKAAVGAAIAVLATAKETVDEVKKKYAGGAAAGAKAGNGGTVPAQVGGGAQVRQVRPQDAPSSKPGGGPLAAGVATMEAVNTAELKEPEDAQGHGATREAATAVPALPGHGGGNGANGGGNGSGPDGGRLRVSPLAKRIAADKNVDLSQVQGSGPGGRIVQKDVLAAAERGPSQPQQPSRAEKLATPQQPAMPARVGSGQTEKVQLTKMRTAIATALQRSKQNVPHFYETMDIDVEELTKLRERLNQKLEKEKVRLSVGDFVTQAVAAALKRHPILNATFDAAKNEITRYGDVNLGVAVALPDGLIVPVLRGVDQMGLKEIRQRSVDLVERARAQRLKGDEMKGATFTVSNLGAYGVREFMAIVNPPEVGILAVGAAEKRAVVKGDQVVARTVMTVTLSADHRVVDGATAAEFLRTLKEMLEEPGMQLL
jgi:pyruvate dehydrogenase E2 component (dihydrolipoamide acetyltransferase)